MNKTHDPMEYVRGLQQLLVSDKKRIGFLFGAGSSLAKKNKDSIAIPAIGEMTRQITETLSINPKFKDALAEIRAEIEKGKDFCTIETILSSLERKIQVLGGGVLNGLNVSEFETLKSKLKSEIQQAVSIHAEIEKSPADTIHSEFAEWIKRADKKFPIEIFTTNYDYLFEIALEYCGIAYFDGFTGAYKPFFDAEAVEDMKHLPKQTKLWKIHGSLGWHLDDNNNRVWRKDSDTEDILIYPSALKYDQTRKQPYVALGDRLSNFLKQPDSVLITCGYSFGDYHINERIMSALKSNISAHVYAFIYDKMWDGNAPKYSIADESELARLAFTQRKLTVIGMRSAIIGCKFGDWKLQREPDPDDSIIISSYFDEDAAQDDCKEKNKTFQSNEVWTGRGEFRLNDFKFFVEFLKSMMVFEAEDNK